MISHSETSRITCLRLSNSTDITTLKSFYSKNRHQYVAFRPHRLALLAAEGCFIVAERGEEVVAAGGFDHYELPGKRKYVELIQGRVIRAGSGLYRLLIAWRILAAVAKHGEEPKIFCEIDEVNARARSVYECMGFRRFAPERGLHVASIESLPIDKRPEALGYGFVWYRISRQTREKLHLTMRKSVASDNYAAFISPGRAIEISEDLRALALRPSSILKQA